MKKLAISLLTIFAMATTSHVSTASAANFSLFGNNTYEMIIPNCTNKREYNYFMDQWTTNEVCNPNVISLPETTQQLNGRIIPRADAPSNQSGLIDQVVQRYISNPVSYLIPQPVYQQPVYQQYVQPSYYPSYSQPSYYASNNSSMNAYVPQMVNSFGNMFGSIFGNNRNGNSNNSNDGYVGSIDGFSPIGEDYEPLDAYNVNYYHPTDPSQDRSYYVEDYGGQIDVYGN